MRYPTCGAICGSFFLYDPLLKKHPFLYCEQCVNYDRISSMKFERRVEGPDHNILAGKRQKGGMRSQTFQIATYVNKIFASKQELEGVKL